MEKITIKEVAKACGVGVGTVSRAINNDPKINETTRNLILQKIEELGYIPNNSARNLGRTEGKAIAVLVKGMDNPMFSGMLKIMEDIIKEKSYSMVIQHVDAAEDEAQVALQLTKEKRLCGIIFLGGIAVRSGTDLRRITVPYVISTVGARVEGLKEDEYSSVAVDDQYESYNLTRRLIAQGHRKIAFFAGAENDTSIGMLRLNGYKGALHDAGLRFDEKLVYYLPADNEEYSFENGYRAARQLMHDKRDCDAVFAVADVMAVGAVRAFMEAGKRIPEEYAVVGFDGIPITEYVYPSITTLAQPFKEMAEETARLLVGIIDGETGHKHLRFEGTLIERETT